MIANVGMRMPVFTSCFTICFTRCFMLAIADQLASDYLSADYLNTNQLAATLSKSK